MGEQETAVKGIGGVLGAVACEMDPVRGRHLGQDILNSAICLLEADEWRGRGQVSDGLYLPLHAGEVGLPISARLRDSKQANFA